MAENNKVHTHKLHIGHHYSQPSSTFRYSNQKEEDDSMEEIN
jgi:hypothetical protein